MRPPESFHTDLSYEGYLKEEYVQGRLLGTTVGEATKAELIDQILSPQLNPGIYAEIGPALNPYFVGSNRLFNKDARYLGVDGGRSDYGSPNIAGWTEYMRGRYAKDFMAAAARKVASRPDAPFAHLVWGDAQQLPFQDSNNTAQPIHETFARDVVLQASMHYRSMRRLAREQARVLAAAGLLIFRETGTDFSSEAYSMFPSFLTLLAALEDAGFRKRLIVRDYDPESQELIKRFPGGNDDEGVFGGYYLICQQGDSEIAPDTPSSRSRLARLLGKVVSPRRL